MRRIGSRAWPWLRVACGALTLIGLSLGLGWAGWRRSAGLVTRGARAYARHDWSQAADLARLRLKVAPNDTEALRLLARATARLGRDGPANAFFARIGSDLLQAEDLFLLGLGLDRAGRKEEAGRIWERALRLEPDRAETINQLIIRDMAQNRLTEAARLAERLTRQPGWELRGELASGTLLGELSDPAGAAIVLRRALERSESARLDRSALYRYRKLLARALLRIGTPAEARTVLGAVLDDGADPEAFWLLSRAALQEGAVADAAAALEDAGSYRGDHPLEAEPSPFIGANRCALCHRDTFRALEASRHASTLLRGEPLAAVPYPNGPIPDPDNPTVIHAFHRDGERIRFETEAGDKVLRAVVDYAFGSPDHYVSFVGRDEHGRPHILRLSRYRTGRESGWVRTTGHTALPGGGGDFLGKSLDIADGLFKCLFCHSTNPRSVLDHSGPESSDRGIGCERCHGPGAIHEKAVAARFPDPAIVSPAQAPAAGRLRICGQCHSHHHEMPLPRTDPYWIRFQGTTLPWSRCYTESDGALDCMTCHDPHHDADRSEAHYTARCLTCHAAAAPAKNTLPEPTARDKLARRGSTCPVNPETGCVDCHMPPFPSAAIHATFTDHYIRVHPERER